MTQKNIFKWWLVIILVVAIFTRFFNLWDSLQFQGDQGRDAIIVSRIFTKFDPVFIGPVTSVGNMYLGPFYYYFMLPFLALTYPSPIGPVYAIAFLSVLTSYLIYRWGKQMVGELAALIAASLYTFSATAATYARFSWNPNPAPFFALMVIYFTWKAITKSGIYWWVVWLGLSILLQLHYVTFLAAGSAGFIWLCQLIFEWVSLKKTNQNWKFFWQKTRLIWMGTLIGVGIFLVSLLPLMLFDWKHSWLNAKAFQALIFKDKTFESQMITTPVDKVLGILAETDGRSMHILAEINLGKNRPLNRAIVVATLLGLILAIKRHSDPTRRAGLGILAIFLALGILGTATYQHTVFDHYIAYLFPVTALVLGVALTELTKLELAKLQIGKIFSCFLIIGFIGYNLTVMPGKSTGWTIQQIWQTSQTILSRVKPGEKYNIVLLSESKDIDGQNYRYFLTTDSIKSPVLTEQRGEIDTLFIINEEKKLAKVTDSPIYEIVVFPNKQPAEVYQIPGGPEITVLRRYSQTQN